MRSAVLATAVLMVGSVVSADTISYDLDGIEFYGGTLSELATLDTGMPGEQILSLQVDEGLLETFTNTGVPNYASEAAFGLAIADADGFESLFFFFPFPTEYTSGLFGPADSWLDVSDLGLYIPESGQITTYAGSSWTDGSGLPAGEWLDGALIIEYVPAPGAVALLALAGFAGARRRRR